VRALPFLLSDSESFLPSYSTEIGRGETLFYSKRSPSSYSLSPSWSRTKKGRRGSLSFPSIGLYHLHAHPLTEKLDEGGGEKGEEEVDSNLSNILFFMRRVYSLSFFCKVERKEWGGGGKECRVSTSFFISFHPPLSPPLFPLTLISNKLGLRKGEKRKEVRRRPPLLFHVLPFLLLLERQPLFFSIISSSRM